VRLTPDGKTLMTAGEGSVLVWDVATSTLRWRVTSGGTLSLAEISPDGGTILTVVKEHFDEVAVWRQKSPGRPDMMLRHGNWAVSAEFDPTGTRVVTHEFLAGFRVWSADTGKEIGPMIRSSVNSSRRFLAKFDASGRLLVVPQRFGITVRDVATGKMILDTSWEEGQGRPIDVQFLGGDGRYVVVSVNEHVNPFPLRIYDVRTGAMERELPAARCTSSDTSGRWALCTFGSGVDARTELWDVKRGVEVQSFPRAAKGATLEGWISPDGSTILIEELPGKTAVLRPAVVDR
jgi:WD40 repeat protein